MNFGKWIDRVFMWKFQSDSFAKRSGNCSSWWYIYIMIENKNIKKVVENENIMKKRFNNDKNIM